MIATTTEFDPTYAHLDDPVLSRALTILAAEPPLDTNLIDYNLANPDKVREVLGHTIRLAHGVENRVEPEYAPSVTALHTHHPVLSISTPLWLAHEKVHGEILDNFLNLTELTALRGNEITGRISHHHVVKLFMALSTDFENMTEWITASYAELNEFMTGLVYTNLGNRAEAIGERALNKVTKLIRPQEGIHLGIYSALRKWVERKMYAGTPAGKIPPELKLGRRIVKHSMRSVGTEDFGIEAIGRSLEELSRISPMELKTKIQQRARQILDDPNDSSFVEFYNRAIQKAASRKFASGK